MKIYKQRYEKGLPVTGVEIIGDCQEDHTGTKTTFKPDEGIFEETVYDFDTLIKRFREMAFLNKLITITLIDDRHEEKNEIVLHYEGGISSFVQYINKNKQPIHPDVIYFESKKDGMELEVAMQYTDSFNENVYSYANNIATTEGGTHITGFRTAITKVVNDYARKTNQLKERTKIFQVKMSEKD